MKYIPYNKNLKEFSHKLRNNSTLSEVLLWDYLQAGKMLGYKFNRQKPLLNYIVDFYCKPLNFDDLMIKKDIDNVIRTLEQWIISYEKNPPNPL